MSVVGLPEYAAALLDTTIAARRRSRRRRRLPAASASSSTPATATSPPPTGAAPDTLGEIGSVDVDLRVHAGDPSGVPAYLPPADTPHVVALADVESLDDLELVASAHVDKIKVVHVPPGPGRHRRHHRAGDGIKPLKVYANADLSDLMRELVPDALRAHIIGEIDVTPLPLHVRLPPGRARARTSARRPRSPSTSAKRVEPRCRRPDLRERLRAGLRRPRDHLRELEIDNIPEHVVATIGKRLGPLTGNTRDSDTGVDLELIPTTNPTVKPNVRSRPPSGCPPTSRSSPKRPCSPTSTSPARRAT